MKRGFCYALFQFPQEFISKPGKRTSSYLFSVMDDRLIRPAFNSKSGSGGMAYDANHSDRILVKSFIRIADGLNDPMLEVSDSTDIVDNGKICNIVEKAINRDISAQGILCRGSKTFFSDDLASFCFHFLEFRSTPESGYLNDLSSFKKNMGQPKPASNNSTILKESIDLMGVRIGGDIKVFRELSEEEISNTSTDEIS
jgi:hypothetical protein